MDKRKGLGSILVLLLALSPARDTSAQGLPVVEPAEIGLSAQRLEAVTRFLEDAVEAKRIAGAVALVARHGRVGYLRSVGHSSVARAEPMRSNQLFRIASMTKPITSAAVMSLVEDGELGLSDPVSRHLPEFGGLRVLASTSGGARLEAARREVTIHDLLTHTSGITYGSSGPPELDRLYAEAGVLGFFLPAEDSTSDLVERIATLPLRFHPGEAWSYGLSIDVLGRVVEKVSGLTLGQFVRERFFRPLGMRDSFFFVPDAKVDRLAGLYTSSPDAPLEEVGDRPVTRGMRFAADYCHAGSRRLFSGGGGLVSTAGDYLRFAQMMLNGGELDGIRVLRRSSVERMTRHQIGDLTIPDMGHGDGFGYGFGIVTEREGAEEIASAGTFGWGGVFNTYFWVDPQESLIGVLMTQIFPFDRTSMRREIKRLVYDAIDDSGFARLYWFEKGLEHGNPYFNGRQLRVNSPEASVHPTFSSRSEPRSSGMMRILVEEDLLKIRRADLYFELWGGHPGTANKRVALNGRYRCAIPEVGCAEGHCTHQYPSFNVPAMGLVRGYNALQFACDLGTTFWGHYIVDNACVRIGLDKAHKAIADAGLSEFSVVVEAAPDPERERIRLRLAGTPASLGRVAAVHYQGRYLGYDENGNALRRDWHGMTRDRRPYGHLGSSARRPFELDWDTRLLPAQKDVRVRAIVQLEDQPALDYTTAAASGLEISARPGHLVGIHYARDLPDHFWSRAGRLKTCHIDPEVDPAKIESAELHVVAWTGGPGDVREYFRLNGHHFPVADGHEHRVVYSRLPVEPGLLKARDNRIELLSDTEHHGIEILLPGPALVVRARR